MLGSLDEIDGQPELLSDRVVEVRQVRAGAFAAAKQIPEQPLFRRGLRKVGQVVREGVLAVEHRVDRRNLNHGLLAVRLQSEERAHATRDLFDLSKPSGHVVVGDVFARQDECRDAEVDLVVRQLEHLLGAEVLRRGHWRRTRRSLDRLWFAGPGGHDQQPEDRRGYRGEQPAAAQARLLATGSHGLIVPDHPGQIRSDPYVPDPTACRGGSEQGWNKNLDGGAAKGGGGNRTRCRLCRRVPRCSRPVPLRRALLRPGVGRRAVVCRPVGSRTATAGNKDGTRRETRHRSRRRVRGRDFGVCHAAGPPRLVGASSENSVSNGSSRCSLIAPSTNPHQPRRVPNRRPRPHQRAPGLEARRAAAAQLARAAGRRARRELSSTIITRSGSRAPSRRSSAGYVAAATRTQTKPHAPQRQRSSSLGLSHFLTPRIESISASLAALICSTPQERRRRRVARAVAITRNP